MRKTGFYRHPDGQERLWFEPEDIEVMMEVELKKAGLYPTGGVRVVDLERFIDRYLKCRLDQYGELEEAVLGLTEFPPGQSPRILINQDLTGAIDRDDTPMGLRGRWRATLAHEASHVLMHRVLFQLAENQPEFPSFGSSTAKEPQCLMRCEKKNVVFRGGGSDWREVQANMGMASLLMPRGIVRDIVSEARKNLRIGMTEIGVETTPARQVAEYLSVQCEVSRQAATIRLEVLGHFVHGGQFGVISGG